MARNFNYDIVGQPGFGNATFSHRYFLTGDLLKYYTNRFCFNYNGKGILQLNDSLNPNFDFISRIIEYELNIKNDGHKLDVLILTENEKTSHNTIGELCRYFNTNQKRRNFIDDQRFDIEAMSISDRVAGFYNYICGRSPSDLVIVISDILPLDFHNNIRSYIHTNRRDGQPLIKTIYITKDYNNVEILKNDGYHYDYNHNWSEEEYKKEVRQKKFDRILKNN